jgi:hypothetical protein
MEGVKLVGEAMKGRDPGDPPVGGSPSLSVVCDQLAPITASAR